MKVGLMMEIFPAGKPVVAKDLVGRETEIKKFLELLKTGQSIIISAPRRYGKTSVLLELQRILHKQRYYTAYIDLFSCLNKYDLATTIIEKTLENKKIRNFITKLQISGTYDDIEYALKIGSGKVEANKLLKEALLLPEKIAKRDISFKFSTIFSICSIF